MTKIILRGCNGKMGRVIDSCISGREDMEIVAGIDINREVLSSFPVYENIKLCQEQADVIIDFSNPIGLEEVLEFAIEHKIALVAATTGYSDEQVLLIKKSAEKIPVFFTFNLSLGINLLVDLAKKATAILGGQFDIEIIEKHHNQKIDAPSGTAIMLADAVNSVSDNQYQYEYDRHSKRQKRKKNEVGIHSVRGGTIVGEHEVIFAGRDEVITLSHCAMSKEVFAVGAVNAAEFMNGKKAGLYEMSDMI